MSTDSRSNRCWGGSDELGQPSPHPQRGELQSGGWVRGWAKSETPRSVMKFGRNLSRICWWPEWRWWQWSKNFMTNWYSKVFQDWSNVPPSLQKERERKTGVGNWWGGRRKGRQDSFIHSFVPSFNKQIFLEYNICGALCRMQEMQI